MQNYNLKIKFIIIIKLKIQKESLHKICTCNKINSINKKNKKETHN